MAGSSITKVKKPNKGKRFLILLVITFMVGIVIGYMSNHITPEVKQDEAAQVKIPKAAPYGQITNIVKSEPMKRTWENGMTFKPLNVDMNNDLQEYTFFLSKAYNLDFPFVMAVIDQESKFNPNAVSKTNDFGLMQINKCNHQWMQEDLGVTNMLDPYQNINAGAYILKNLFDKHQDPSKVLMAYNMGERGASRLWGRGITQSKYSKEVMEKAKAFSLQINEKE